MARPKRRFVRDDKEEIIRRLLAYKEEGVGRIEACYRIGEEMGWCYDTIRNIMQNNGIKFPHKNRHINLTEHKTLDDMVYNTPTVCPTCGKEYTINAPPHKGCKHRWDYCHLCRENREKGEDDIYNICL